MPSTSPTTTTKEIHDWVRASFYRTGFVLAAFVALLVASTPAPLGIVPMVFLFTLPFTLAAAYGVDWFQGNLGSEEEAASTRATATTRPSARDRSVSGAEADAALERLRERYAAGELTDEEFERRVERLLETAELRELVVEAAERRAAGEGGDGRPGTDATGRSAAGSPGERSRAAEGSRAGDGDRDGSDGSDWFDDLGDVDSNGGGSGDRDRSLVRDT